jgi:hypothetical protein
MNNNMKSLSPAEAAGKSRQMQMELAKIAQQKSNRAAELFSEILNTELFPDEKLSTNWRYLVAKAIIRTSPLSHRISLKDFLLVAEVNPEAESLTLFQFGVFSNAIEAVSINDLSLTREAYKIFMTEALEHITWYNERVKKIREEVNLQVEAEFAKKSAEEKGLKIAEA